jgi:hypothetical protein
MIRGIGQAPNTPDEWWPSQAAGEAADYSFDAVNEVTINGVIDPIVGLSIAAMPSGTGEVALSRLSLTNNLAGQATLVVVWLTGGVPGRTYYYNLVITTTAGRVLPVLIGQVCDPTLAANPLPVAPAPGFGTSITWP